MGKLILLSLKTLHDSKTLYKNNRLQQFSYNKLSTADDLDDA